MRRKLFAIGLFLQIGLIFSAANVAISQVSVPSFKPAWQTLSLGAGGNVFGLHTYPDGTILSHNDTYGGHLYVSSGSCSIGSYSIAAPCWQQLVTTNSLPAKIVTPSISGSGNLGVGELIACPSNTQVLYMIFNKIVYVSTNKGTTWVATPQTTTLQVNGGPAQHPWMACDPHNPDVIYVGTPSAGVFVSTNGRSGASSTWTQVTVVGTATGGKGHNIAFDPTSSAISGFTQRFMICTYGKGCYETLNGGTAAGGTFTLTTSTPTVGVQIVCDKFSQFWVVDGTNMFKYVSTSWSTITGPVQPQTMAIDPNSSTLGTNHLVMAKPTGQ